MVGIGLVALMLAMVEHRANMTRLRATYGAVPRSSAAAIAALSAGLGGFALVAMLFQM